MRATSVSFSGKILLVHRVPVANPRRSPPVCGVEKSPSLAARVAVIKRSFIKTVAEKPTSGGQSAYVGYFTLRNWLHESHL